MNLLGMKRKLLPLGSPQTGGGGSGGGGGPTQTTVSNTNIPEYARPYVETMLGSAQQQVYNYDDQGNATGFRPYIPYGATVDASGNITNTAQEQAGAAVAGFSPLQQQAQYGIGQMRVPGQFNTGTGFAALGGIGAANIANQAAGAGQQYNMMATNPFAQQAFMSPYMQNVVDVQKQEAIRDYGKMLPGMQAQAVRQGAFGGSRQAIEAAEARRNLGTQLGQIQAQGTQRAFEQGQQAQQFGANLGLQGYGTALQGTGQLTAAGRTMADIGGQQLQAQQGILGLQSQAGAQQQQLEQQKVNQAIQNYAMQQQYPMQQLAAMSGLLRGLPLQSATTQSYQAPPSAISQLSGLGLSGAAAYGLMKKEGGIIKSYAEGGNVTATDTAAPPASSIAMNVPVPEGYKFDAATGQYNELNPGNSILDLLRGDSGILAKLKGKRMAEGGITRDVMLNPEKYSTQMIDRSTKNGLINDIVGLAALQQKNQEVKDRQAQAAMAQGTPPTVKDQILAEAQQLQGIDNAPSNLPTEYAGGGIVAFQAGGDTMGGFETGSDTSETRAKPKLDEYVIDPMTGEKLFSGYTPKAETTSAAAPAKADTGIKILPNEPKAKPSIMNAPAPAADTGMGAGGIDDLIRQSIGDIKAGGERDKDARKEAKLMAMLQAGLGIASGTSPYALANVKGALPALQGYQEEMRGLRGDEAKRIAQIAALNLKGAELKNELKKMGISEELYKAQAKYYTARANAPIGTAGLGAVPPAVSDKVMTRFQGYEANPTQAPFFSSLPKNVQTGLTDYGPKTKSYQDSLAIFRQYNDKAMQQYLNSLRGLSAKTPTSADQD